jgi:hypothetical protein
MQVKIMPYNAYYNLLILFNYEDIVASSSNMGLEHILIIVSSNILSHQ